MLPLSIDLAPTQWRAPDTNGHVAGAATRGRAVNAERPDDVRCLEARVQVAARHGTACVCPAVHNNRPQKTHERTTQFFRSIGVSMDLRPTRSVGRFHVQALFG
jgi:hypothetical protein